MKCCWTGNLAKSNVILKLARKGKEVSKAVTAVTAKEVAKAVAAVKAVALVLSNAVAAVKAVAAQTWKLTGTNWSTRLEAVSVKACRLVDSASSTTLGAWPRVDNHALHTTCSTCMQLKYALLY